MRVIAPLTVVLIALMLWLTFGRASDVLIVMASLPVALAGGVWLLWGLDFHLSVAVLVGFIALSGVAVRSEEHTSELQSLMRISYAVFCLKNKKKTNI